MQINHLVRWCRGRLDELLYIYNYSRVYQRTDGGRTPEFLGKKVEAREMKIATVVALLHPFVILVGTALSTYLFAHHPDFVASRGRLAE